MRTDAPSAESSTAPSAPETPAPYSQAWLEAMNAEQRATWERTGEGPASPESADQPAESAPAEPAEQAASTDATPDQSDSEPDAPVKGEKGEKLRKRTADLQAENEALRAELRERHRLRQELSQLEQRSPQRDQPAESRPATPPTKAEWERYKAMPEAPRQDQFDNYDDWSIAMGVFIADRRYAERQAQSRAEHVGRERAQAFQRVLDGATKRIQEYEATHEGFAQGVHPDLLRVEPASLVPPGTPIGPHNVLAEEILKSDLTPQLLLHFSSHPEDWQKLCAMRPPDLLRAFGRLEVQVASPTPPAQAAEPQPSSPEPPRTLGRKTAQAPDEIEAALARGDFAAYERAMNARETAALQG